MEKLGLENMALQKRKREEEEREGQRVEKEERRRKEEGERERAEKEENIPPYAVRASSNRKRCDSQEYKIERSKKKIREKRREKATWI